MDELTPWRMRSKDLTAHGRKKFLTRNFNLEKPRKARVKILMVTSCSDCAGHVFLNNSNTNNDNNNNNYNNNNNNNNNNNIIININFKISFIHRNAKHQHI